LRLFLKLDFAHDTFGFSYFGEHELVYDNLAIPDLNVIGYLGIPLTTTQGEGLGSFCAIDSTPRQWSEREIYIMQELAQSVMTEIELRSAGAAGCTESD